MRERTVAAGAGPDAFALADEIRAGRQDPVEVVERALARIREVDDQLRAFVEVDGDGARREALERRRTQRAGRAGGALFGVPVGVKDLFDVAGQVTRAGSDVPPGPAAIRDAPAVARLRAAGAVILGRTRTHEFAWGMTTQHPRWGGTANPHDLARIPGGSSGGSAAAVAGGLVPLALGTDTGCSLRLPAAFCGLVAHKPTFGLVPLDGVVPLAPSLDHGGVLVRSVPEARRSLELLSGSPLPPPAPVAELRVGIALLPDPPADSPARVPAVSRALERLLRATADHLDAEVRSVRRVDVSAFADGPAIYAVVQGAEALAWHRETGRWPRHADRYGDDVRSRLARAERLTPADVRWARRARAELREAGARLFDEVDVVVLPVCSVGPPPLNDPDGEMGQHGGLRAAVLPWTVPANLGGWPACSVPVGRDDDGLPVGVQVVGPAGSDARVLDVAARVAVSLD